MFAVGFAGSAGWVWWNRRREAANIEPDVEPTPVFEARSPAQQPTFATPVRATPAEQLPAVAADGDDHPPIAQLLFATRINAGDRECPTCHRRFSETTMLCPFDATPLEQPKRRRTTRPAETQNRRPTCLRCGRRYESAARYCYHDGVRLSSDSPSEVPIISVCRTCGSESLTDEHHHCDCEDPELVEIDPSQSQVQLPTLPLLHCRRCDHVGMGIDAHCPNDGELLYPVMNVALNALPPTGIGPRRKVCEKCGRKFSSAARHCAYDGTRLTTLN